MGSGPTPLYPNGTVVKNRYRLVRALGSGAMGSVYEAVEIKLGKPVAVKFLEPLLARDPRNSERFEREARTAAQLKHDNVCDVTDIDVTDEGVPFLVMELLGGETLKDLLKRERPIPLERAIELTRQMLSALAAAHHKGFVHRDLKPANIFLTRASDGRERVKLIDFGIAKVLDESDGVSGTTTGAVFGTPNVMSPEQICGDVHRIDGRTDIWAVGVNLYLMLTGEWPFRGPGLKAVTKQILFDEPIPPRQLNPSVPSSIEAIILRALAKERGERYRDVQQLWADLDEALSSQVGQGVHPAATPTPPLETAQATLGALDASLTPTEMSVRSGKRRRWHIPAVLAAALIGVLSAWLFLLLSPTETNVGDLESTASPGAADPQNNTVENSDADVDENTSTQPVEVAAEPDLIEPSPDVGAAPEHAAEPTEPDDPPTVSPAPRPQRSRPRPTQRPEPPAPSEPPPPSTPVIRVTDF